MPVFPSEAWYKDVEAILDADEEYKRVGADWEGDIVTIVEAEPGKLDKPFYYYQKPHRGEMEESYEISSPDEKTPAFIISGPYAVWKAVIKGEADAMQSLMQGKIRVKGNMQQLLKYAKFQQMGMDALKKVETTFQDE